MGAPTRPVELWGGPLDGTRYEHDPAEGRYIVLRVRAGWWAAYRVHEWLARGDGTRKAIWMPVVGDEEDDDARGS